MRFPLLVAAVALVWATGARADTFQVASSTVPFSGTFTLDTQTGTITNADLKANGINFTAPNGGYLDGYGTGYFISFFDAGMKNILGIDLEDTTSLQGYTGSTFNATEYPWGNTSILYSFSGAFSDATTPTLPPAPASATPEPSSLALLATGAMAVTVLRRRRVSA